MENSGLETDLAKLLHIFYSPHAAREDWERISDGQRQQWELDAQSIIAFIKAKP